MANNQQLASDSFSSGSLASGWAAAFGLSTCQVVAGNFTEPNALNTTAGQVWTGLTWPNDQSSEVTIQTLTNENLSTTTLYTRMQSGSLSGYSAVIGNGTATINRIDSGTVTQLATVSVTAAAGDVWCLQAAGSLLFLYQNWGHVLNIGDATYTLGSPGFAQFSNVAIADTQVASWRGYSSIQQDGIWTKQGIVQSPITADLQPGLSGPYLMYDNNPQILAGPNVFKMWFNAGVTPGAEGSCYYAESADGINWTRYPTTILANHGAPYLIKVGGTYYMYTQLSQGGGSGMGTTPFYLHTSTDGIHWTQVSSNVMTLGSGGAWDSALIWYLNPITIINGTWYAVYLGGNNGSTYKLSMGLATSPDGINWTKYAGNPVLASSPSGGGVNCSPAFRNINGIWYMWFLANQPGLQVTHGSNDPGEVMRYQSTDLINWTNPTHSIHRYQMYDGSNYVGGTGLPGGIIDVNGQTYFYLQSGIDSGTRTQYQTSLAIAPAPMASIVQFPEDGMPLVATDNFTSGTGNLAPTWITPGGGTKLQIVSGNLVQASVTSTVCTMANTATVGGDHWSEITLQTMVGATQKPSPCVRVQPGNNNFYGVNLTGPLNSAFASLYVYKYIAGVATQIGTAITITPQQGDLIRLSVMGNVLTVYQNGFGVLQVQDYSNALSGGFAGMTITTSGLAQTQISLWSGGNAGVIPNYASLTPAPAPNLSSLTTNIIRNLLVTNPTTTFFSMQIRNGGTIFPGFTRQQLIAEYMNRLPLSDPNEIWGSGTFLPQ